MLACVRQPPNYNSTIEVIEDYDVLKKRLQNGADSIYVLNFWATSCPPCIEEMPHFNRLEATGEYDRLKILLVSLDREKDLEKRVYPFVEKHQIFPEVLVLEDQNYSRWTADIDTSWFGALPATLITNKEKRNFQFGMYESYDDLLEDVETVSE